MIEEIRPSATSRVLANNIILSLQNQPPAYASRDFLVASARWLNGDDLADELGLSKPSFYYKALVAGQCLFFMGLCYTYRSVPYLDRKKIAALRKIFYNVIVRNTDHGLGEETVFDFKYIPSFDFTETEKGEYVAGIQGKGVETRNFRTLVVAGAVMGCLSYVGFRISWGVVKWMGSLVGL